MKYMILLWKVILSFREVNIFLQPVFFFSCMSRESYLINTQKICINVIGYVFPGIPTDIIIFLWALSHALSSARNFLSTESIGVDDKSRWIAVNSGMFGAKENFEEGVICIFRWWVRASDDDREGFLMYSHVEFDTEHGVTVIVHQELPNLSGDSSNTVDRHEFKWKVWDQKTILIGIRDIHAHWLVLEFSERNSRHCRSREIVRFLFMRYHPWKAHS